MEEKDNKFNGIDSRDENGNLLTHDEEGEEEKSDWVENRVSFC